MHPSGVLPAHDTVNTSATQTVIFKNLRDQNAALERQNLIIETRYISLR
jgi:hypothetical protein